MKQEEDTRCVRQPGQQLRIASQHPIRVYTSDCCYWGEEDVLQEEYQKLVIEPNGPVLSRLWRYCCCRPRDGDEKMLKVAAIIVQDFISTVPIAG